MALTLKSIEEPLLSRQQAAVCRNIACAAQLAEAAKALENVKILIQTATEQTKLPDGNFSETASRSLIKVNDILEYLSDEAKRVLMQIRLPAPRVEKNGGISST